MTAPRGGWPPRGTVTTRARDATVAKVTGAQPRSARSPAEVKSQVMLHSPPASAATPSSGRCCGALQPQVVRGPVRRPGLEDTGAPECTAAASLWRRKVGHLLVALASQEGEPQHRSQRLAHQVQHPQHGLQGARGRVFPQASCLASKLAGATGQRPTGCGTQHARGQASVPSGGRPATAGANRHCHWELYQYQKGAGVSRGHR
mmetsp:Transcript_23400/g.54712  ORF Transcript_23400/g.54712 Transcript_23400/m.54712 type:complete len:204 (-) Transcript_23400:82-693(-)